MKTIEELIRFFRERKSDIEGEIERISKLVPTQNVKEEDHERWLAGWSEDRLIVRDTLSYLMTLEKRGAARPSFQDRVAAAHEPLFRDDPTDVAERTARFFEESNEICQALGMTREEAHALVDYTYDRPAGDPKKEIGSASLTLTSLCVVAGYDRSECEEADLEKLTRPETMARIRAKRSTRHGRGPLPGLDPAATATEGE